MTDATDSSDVDDFTERLLSYFVGDRADQAGRSLARYLVEKPFTGRWFERFADVSHPNEITARDLAAVTMLGVSVPLRVLSGY